MVIAAMVIARYAGLSHNVPNADVMFIEQS